MDGVAKPDEFYLKEWRIHASEIKAKSAMTNLSKEQVLGCEHYLLAVQYERLRNHELALQELSKALELGPQNLDVRREFAWITATGSGVSVRNHPEAIAHALFVLGITKDPDTRDTLAAVYASAGMFDEAVREVRKAISDTSTSKESRITFKKRLQLYQQKTAYRQPEWKGSHPDPTE